MWDLALFTSGWPFGLELWRQLFLFPFSLMFYWDLCLGRCWRLMNHATYNGYLTNTNDKVPSSLLYQHHLVTNHHHPHSFCKDGLRASNALAKEYINSFNPNIQVTIYIFTLIKFFVSLRWRLATSCDVNLTKFMMNISTLQLILNTYKTSIVGTRYSFTMKLH